MNAKVKAFADHMVTDLIGTNRTVVLSRQNLAQIIRAAYKAGQENAPAPTLYIVGYSEDGAFSVIGRAGQKAENFVGLNGQDYAGMITRLMNYDSELHAEFADAIRQHENQDGCKK